MYINLYKNVQICVEFNDGKLVLTLQFPFIVEVIKTIAFTEFFLIQKRHCERCVSAMTWLIVDSFSHLVGRQGLSEKHQKIGIIKAGRQETFVIWGMTDQSMVQLCHQI